LKSPNKWGPSNKWSSKGGVVIRRLGVLGMSNISFGKKGSTNKRKKKKEKETYDLSTQ